MDRHPRANQTGVSRLSRNETEAQKDDCEMGSLQTSRGCCYSPKNNNSSSSRHRRSSSRGSGGKSSYRYVQPANSSTSSSTTVRCAMKMITNITDNNLLYNLRSPKNQQQTLTDTSFVVRVSPRNALATKWMYRELRKKKQIPTKRKRERDVYISLPRSHCYFDDGGGSSSSSSWPKRRETGWLLILLRKGKVQRAAGD